MRKDHALSLTRGGCILQNGVVRNESVSDPVRALLRTRRTFLADVDHHAPERVLARSDVSGTMQLYELRSGDLVELTSLPEPVASAHYVPGARRAVLAVDEGGNERHQLYLIDLDNAAATTVAGFDRLRALTSDPRFGHRFAGVSAGRSDACVRVRPLQWRRLRPLAVRSRGRRAPPAVRGRRLVSARLGLLPRRPFRVGATPGPAPTGHGSGARRRRPPVKRGSRFRIPARRRWSGRQRG